MKLNSKFFMLVAMATTYLCTLTAQAQSTDWPSYGLDYTEQRFSPLTNINDNNINQLGLAWYLDLPEAKSLEATPLIVDGVLYFTANDAITYAADARTGKMLWRYDPKVWEKSGRAFRQLFHVNRGVAYWQGKVYVGTFDGRLVALNAKSGKPVWSTQTINEGKVGYITGAPRAFNNIVIIGNGGTEAGTSRGYVTAYNATTGKQLWRFYTVPGDPANGFENEAMAMAAKTWTGEWWKFGGGATAWNALTYDPELNRVYIGTGNGSPWNQKIRSPEGGDNLFVCSIIAVDANTGEYIWHYQTNPGETWDFNSSQDIVLADLSIEGTKRKVILHAPKNGFFYVIDRTNGQLISAEKLGKVTWAEKIDLKTGRPVETPEARFPNREGLIYPGGAGMHNWQAMSYNSKAGLVYIPKLEMPGYYTDKKTDRKSWSARPFFFNSGYDVVESDDLGAITPWASLLAWDPIQQKKAWEVNIPTLWNGGTLTTNGNLVFQGNGTGEFAAYHTETGEKLWSANAGHAIVGSPITYQLDGKQYVAVLSGWGGALAMFGIAVKEYGWHYGKQPRRLLVYALDENTDMPISPKAPPPTPIDIPRLEINTEQAQAGGQLFNTTCFQCHGPSAISGGAAPDLRASPVALNADAFRLILKDGLLQSRGMPIYDDLSEDEIKNLYMYIRHRARTALRK